jgi:signal transduction histidine kinase
MKNNPRPENPDLPLAQEIAGMLTLEIRRFLREKQESGNILATNKTLSIVSHELKTPVTSLKTILQVIQNRLQGDPTNFNFADNAEYIAFSLREIDKLTVLVNDLLDFNKLNRQALQFNLQNTDIQPIVAGAVKNITTLCSTHVITHTGTDMHCNVSLDAGRFEQVLVNLVTNAVKYSPKGSLITVNTVANERGVIITVIDEGQGMNKEDLTHIFEPYYRTPTAVASGIGGLGIGLFISKEIIDAHEGTLTINSNLGEGTIVTITLPTSTNPDDSKVIHKFNTPHTEGHPTHETSTNQNKNHPSSR